MARRAVRGGQEQLTSVAHQVDFRLDATFYAGLLRLAEQAGLVRADGKPRVAELIRVLLVSVLWVNRPVNERTAIAVYCNGVLTLSGQLAGALADLRASVAGLVNLEAPLAPSPPRAESGKGKVARSSVVSVIFDDFLRRSLSQQLEAAIPRLQREGLLPDKLSEARPLPDVVFVRDLLRQAVEAFDKHRPVIVAYATAIRRMESSIRAAVRLEREAIESALQES